MVQRRYCCPIVRFLSDSKAFSPWNYFNGGSGNLVTPESASVEQQRAILRCMSVGMVDARLSEIKRGRSVVGVSFDPVVRKQFHESKPGQIPGHMCW